ncbi:hypothetical protein C7G42_05480 [Bradyrhizobium sp. MOS003]|nr:hypothetical protein C7G42_05480 [Bradyrhizobium sp. MOS003]
MDARIKSGHDRSELLGRMRHLQFCLLALFAASPAHAQDRPIGFLTPSNNVACQFFTDVLIRASTSHATR